MLYFFKILFILININREPIRNWSGGTAITSPDIDFSSNESKPELFLALSTFQSIINDFWLKVQDGLTLADIENVLFFIIVIRFGILAIRYNLRTSLYITCVGIFAGYLWYRHLIDIITSYRTILLQLPYFNKLGVDGVELQNISDNVAIADFNLGANVHWYNPGQLIYYAFINGITTNDPETGFRHYIDPFSMYISNLNESDKSFILPYYYKLYNKFIPQAFNAITKLWNQIAGIAAYCAATRIGKRYCPYAVRWHWTILMLISFPEQALMYFVYRISYFQGYILVPQAKLMVGAASFEQDSLRLQINALNLLLTGIVCFHLILVLLALVHSICGQYFYVPFFAENAELHTGPRPKNSVYSGGKTAWQDKKKTNIQRFFPQFWYGWFGRGTDGIPLILKPFQSFGFIIIRFVRKQLRKLLS